MTGPTHGAATRPMAMPMSRGPRKPVRPPPMREVRLLGSWMSKRPAIDSPMAKMMTATDPMKTGV